MAKENFLNLYLGRIRRRATINLKAEKEGIGSAGDILNRLFETNAEAEGRKPDIRKINRQKRLDRQAALLNKALENPRLN